MTLYDAVLYASVALLVAAIIFIPRQVALRRRAFIGVSLFVIGWAGLVGGLALSDRPFLQSETVALVWVGGFAFLLVLAAVMLVTAAIEGWRRKRGARKQL